MTYRKILVPLLGIDDEPALATAFALAERFRAHVEGLHIGGDARDTLPFLGEQVTASVVEDLIAEAEQDLTRRRQAAHAAFRAFAGTSQVSSVFLDESDRGESELARRACVADLVVMGRGTGALDPRVQMAFETALLQGGRPVLLTPRRLDGTPDRIAVAWNGRREAARAVGSALPLLERAAVVRVLTVATSRTKAEEGELLRSYLAYHDVEARLGSPVEPEPSVGEALLRAAEGADLLVMGGFGHGRWREVIMGGVTRHVVDHAALPVLFAH